MIRLVRRSTATLAAIGLVVSGCTVGPHYRPPAELPVAAPAAVAAVSGEFNTSAPGAAWWRSVDDPVLVDLIERARHGNVDLREALARLRQSRALFADSALDRWPRVTASGAYVRSDEQALGLGDQRVNIAGAQLGFDATWELDIFGRVEHGVEAARAASQATAIDLSDVQVSVTAEVARNYFVLRGAQARRRVAEENIEAQRQTLDLTQRRFDIGAGDPVDLEAARAHLANTESSLPDLATTEAQAAFRLAVLLGERPGALDELLKAGRVPAFAAEQPLPVGDVSAFLRHRPDVRAAERRLAAQTARVGVATADLFPRVTLVGVVGLLSGDVSKLFTSSGQAWSVTPTVSWPAFDLGGARARLRAQRAQADEDLAVYDGAVLRAIEDLQDATVAYGQRQSQILSLARQSDASRRADTLAHIRYREGAIDFLRVLDADRTLYAAQDALTNAETLANTDMVAIYKSLGDG